MLEEIDATPAFQKEEIQSSTMMPTIGSLANLKVGQLLNIKGYVNCLTNPKTVTQKTSQQQVEVAECQLTDSSGSTKLVLWGKFASMLSNDQTYEFKNLRLKMQNQKVHLSTTQMGCSITPAMPLENICPPKELPTSYQHGVFTVDLIPKLSSYHMCRSCSKKITLPESGNLVECESCHSAMNKKKCPKVFYAKMLFSNDQQHKLHFTLFNESLKQLVDIYNKSQSADAQLNYDQLTDIELKGVLVELERLNIT